VLQCAAVYCRVLQCAAVCCSVLHCVADCCKVLQFVTAHTLRAFLLFSLSAKRPKSCCVSSWSPIMSILRSILRKIALSIWLEYGGVVLGSRLDYTLDLLKFVTILFDTDSDSFSTTSYVTRLTATYCNTMTDQFSTISCATVHTATRCNTLQNTATHCNIRTPSCANLHRSASHPAILCNTLQHPREAHCTTLRLTATPHLA